MLSRGLQAGRSLLRTGVWKDCSVVRRQLSDGVKNGASSNGASSSVSAEQAAAKSAASSSPKGPSSISPPTTSSSSSTSGASAASSTEASSRLMRSMQESIEAAQAAAVAQASSGAGAGAQEAAADSRLMRLLSAAGNTLFIAALGTTAYFGYYTLRYNTSEMQDLIDQRKKPENEFPGSSVWVPVMSWYADNRKQLAETIKKYSDPPSEHLLPDLPLHARHVRTLVLDLDDTLIHSDWTRGRGWRTFKRPGAEDFLRQMAQYYELVIYTDQLPTYADPILDRLDPQRFIQYRLYRDSTQYVNGKHVRNLNYLNRDLDKVLLITANPDAHALQPDNAVKLKPWKLESGDTALLDLIPLLEQVFRTNVPDVRAVVRSFEGQDIPSAFRERMLKANQKASERRGLFGSLRR
ncbi:g732 [Coccomyxa viridis]|uniref:Mitochondrial import inner membrane translocase subunit TIM50 n=1 Tax=Coccomyxa viridis TaxID=1274662 RepID=A0ABP1FLS6_9CHLO